MNKLVLKIESDVLSYHRTNEKLKLVMNLEMHFTSADVIVDKHFDATRLMDVLEQFGRRFVYFKLKSPQFISPLTLLEFLKQMPELKQLILDFSQVNHTGRPQRADSSIEALSLTKLKKLVVKGDFDVFQLIDCPSLQDLHTEEGIYNPKMEKLLKASPNLEGLRTNLSVIGRMSPKFPFKLRKFHCPKSIIIFDENVAKFLWSQAASMETIEVECHNSEFHEIVLTKCKRLRILSCDLRHLKASEEFYQSFQPLPLVTEINSNYGFSSESATRAVLGNCPKLVKLKCLGDKALPDHLDYIAVHNKNLQVLETYTIRDTDARFQRLKTLTLEIVEDADCLNEFLKANPTIDTFRIVSLSDSQFSDKSLGSLINETSLKHVHLKGDERTMDQVYIKLKGGFGTWKTLTLSSLMDHKFTFPENPADWKPCQHLCNNEIHSYRKQN